MQPYFFSTPEANLFAVYHQPGGASRQTAVLLCYPLFHEYLSTHRTCRQLAGMLGSAGFPVLRFDYFGCGDSGGSAAQASLDGWLRNVAAAADEIKSRANVSKLCVIGLRFGATLATLAACRNSSIDSLVLWDPIARGPDYLADLSIFHDKVLDEAAAHSPGMVRPAVRDGLSLFGFQSSLTEEMRAIDLLTMSERPAQNVLLIESTAGKGSPAFAAHLQQQVSNFQHKNLPAKDLWKLDFDLAMPPREILSTIVNWISGVCE
ncbi:MAG: alpha/beta hydrolase [Bryobacterales bacterium]